MKKVLFVTNYPSPYRVNFFNEFGKDERIDLTVVFLERISEQKHRSPEWFDESYIHFSPVFLKKRFSLPGRKVICKDIKQIVYEEFDEIIFGGYSDPTIMYAMVLLQHRGIPYSIEIDGGFVSHDSFVKYRIKKKFISSASKWYSTGNYSDKYLLNYGADVNRIFHYPFSSLNERDIDGWMTKESFLTRKKGLKKELGIQENKTVLSIGQFIKRKGFDVLLEAMALLPKDIGVYIVGGTPPEEYISLAAKCHLDNVHFLQFQTKDVLTKYYQAADVFALATREDIWGLVINEALANGIPVVTTDRCIAGIELISQGKNGFIVPVNDAASLAQKINQVLSLDGYLMRNAAIEIAKDYTIQKMVQRHIEIIYGEYGR